MIEIAELLKPAPSPLWKLVRQCGVSRAVAVLPFGDSGDEKPWDFMPLLRMKTRFNDHGFEVSAIESSPPMTKTRLGLPGRDEEIEWFIEMVRNMGRLGIPVVCYNWMAVVGWLRTSFTLPARGGAIVSGFDADQLRNAPLTEYGEVPEEQLWSSLEYFLRAVVPEAEASGVKLAMHPDDPPLSPIRGIGRIMRSVENFQRLIDLLPSPANGITLCQGNFALMTSDLPGTIRRFGEQGRVHFVHMRDVEGTPERFSETFHDEGPTDFLECFRAYKEVGFEGVLRPDHVPTMEGDSNEEPGYSSIGRLFAIGYLAGLREAVYGRSPA